MQRFNIVFGVLVLVVTGWMCVGATFRETKKVCHCRDCVTCLPHLPRNNYKPPKRGLRVDNGRCPSRDCQEYQHLRQVLYLNTLMDKKHKCFKECKACRRQIRSVCPKMKFLKRPALLDHPIYSIVFTSSQGFRMQTDDHLCCKTYYGYPAPYEYNHTEKGVTWYPVYLKYPQDDPNRLKEMYQTYYLAERCYGHWRCGITFQYGNMLMTSLEPDRTLGHCVVLFDTNVYTERTSSTDLQFMSVENVISYCACKLDKKMPDID